MKKISLLITIPLILLIAGCNWQMTESIRIVTDPVFQLSLGTRANVFSEFLDVSDELDNMTEDMANLSVREGVAAGSPIVLDMTEEMINISVDDFADETLELDAIDQTIDPISFVVPAVGVSETVALGFDPISLPGTATLPAIPTLTVPEANGSDTITTAVITGSGFTSLTFAAGTLTGSVAVSGGSGGQVVTITSATIMDGAAPVVSADNTPLLADGTLTFPLAGVDLPSSFTMDIGVTVANATPGTFDLDLAFAFSGDSTISEAAGIVVNESVDGTVDIPLASDDLISATVGTGFIDLDLDFPGTWTNLDYTMDMDLIQDQDGALVTVGSVTGVPLVDGAAPEAEWDLAGVTIDQGDMTLEYTVNVDTTPTFTSSINVASGTNEVTGDAIADISIFSAMVVDSAGMDFEQEIATNLDTDLTDLVTDVTFTDPTVTIALDNQLPLDLTVTLTSAAMGLNPGDPYTFTGGNNDSHVWNLLGGPGGVLNIPSVVDSAIDADSDPDVDFIVEISSPDYDEANDELTLRNVTAGDTYTFEGGVTADLEIASVVIDSANMAEQFPPVGDDPLDFSMLGDFLPDTITFDNITAFLNLDIDDPGLTLDMMVWAEYSDPDDAEPRPTYYLNLVGNDTGGDARPDTSETHGGNDSIDLSSIATLINNRAMDIVFHYDITASGATINMTGANDRISAILNTSIPFTLHASADSPLEDENGEPLIPDADDDLFGRDGTEDEEIDDYLDMLNSAEVHALFSNTLPTGGSDILGIGFRMTETTNPAGYGNFLMEKEFVISPGVTTAFDLAMSQAQVDRMVEDSSFMPSYEIYLLGPGSGPDNAYSGDHSLVEGFDMNITLWMGLNSDVDYVINFGE